MPEIVFNINVNANGAADAMSSLESAASQTAKDFQAMGDALGGVLDRASKLAEFFQENVTLLSQMKEILGLIGAMNESNQSALNNNLQAIREMTTSIIKQGGTFNDVNRALSAATSTFGGSTANMVYDFFNAAKKRQSFESQHASTRSEQSPIDLGAINPLDDLKARARAATRDAAGRTSVPPEEIHYQDAEHGPRKVPGYGDIGIPEPGSTALHLVEGRGRTSTSTMLYPATDAFNNARQALKENFSNIQNKYGFRTTGVHMSALDAYDQGTRQIDRVLGTRGFGGSLGSFMKKEMFGNRDDVRAAIKEIMSTGPNAAAAFSNAYSGLDRSGGPLQKNSSEELIYNVMKKLDRNLSIANSISGYSIGGKVNPDTGNREGGLTLGQIGGGLGTAYNAYQLANQVAGMVRVGTGYAQNQAQGYGNVDYGRSAGNFMDNVVRSWGGLNPTYSFGNAQQAQNAGIGLGYRGDLLGQYQNAAQSLQIQNGMTQGQTAQAIGTLQQVGMSPAQTAAMIQSMRNTANSNSNGSYFNTSAGQTAGIAAQAGLMQWGGSTSASGASAKISNNSIGSNPILAGTGLNGQDLMNTQFGMAMMSQQLGISYNQMYAYREKMMSTASGANKYIDMYSGGIVKMLSNSVGKDLMTVKSVHELDQYAPILMGVLQGMGINIQGPQEATYYVFDQIQQAKGKFNTVSNASGSATHGPGDQGYKFRAGYSPTDFAMSSSGGSSGSGSSGSGSTVPSPSATSSNHASAQAMASAASQSITSLSSQAAGAVGGPAAALAVEVAFKQPHLDKLLSILVKNKNDSTNGNSAPQTTTSRASFG